uniref:somatostatin receptor type 1-like n=1 Tax=Myxine glutinosa TaxID=7769 RepID=UPI00358ED2F0
MMDALNRSDNESGPTGTEDPPEIFDANQVIVIPFIYGVVCIIGLLGNSMVIYVILRYAKMKTATNIYILNLAVADELFMLSVPFLAVSSAMHHWPFGPFLCRLVLSVDGINMFTSIFCLTVLSVDRYVAVVHPIKAARYRRPTVAKAINCCVWALSLLVILPVIVFADTRPGRSDGSGGIVCNMMWPHVYWSMAFVVYVFLVGFLVPMVAICLCYLLIVLKLRVVALKAGWQQRRRSERKITRMVLMVVAVFVVCWMPFYAVQMLNVFGVPSDATVTQLCVVLSYANSCANPILYGFLSDNFKRSFRRTVCQHWIDSAFEEPLDYRTTVFNRSKVTSRQEVQVPDHVIPAYTACLNGTCTSRVTTL